MSKIPQSQPPVSAVRAPKPILVEQASRSRALRLFWSVFLALALLLGCGIYLASKANLFYLDVSLAAPRPISVQIMYDQGAGWVAGSPNSLVIPASATPVHARFRLRSGPIVKLRIDPAIAPAPSSIVIDSAAIRSRGDELMGISRPTFPLRPEAFRPTNQILQIERLNDHAVRLTSPEGADDPYSEIAIPPLRLDFNWRFFGFGFAVASLLSAGAGAAMYWLSAGALARSGGRRALALWRAAERRPRLAVTIAAVFSMLLSAYPVAFLGKSYVSPDNGCVLLYQSFPTLPGYRTDAVEDTKGSDLAALFLAHIPYAHVEDRAVFRDGELPLWNRFNSGGIMLYGQGQSMFGDPLHCLVLLANDASWAWDLKFLIAKALLATGVGWLVLIATKRLPVSLLLTFSSVFIGFFSFRLNHPAVFSLCYSPWILYCWWQVTDATSRRRVAGWGGGGLLLANWSVLNSGTIKEAYMLLLGLNFCGALLLLFSANPREIKFGKFLALAWAGAVFGAISAPVWLTFSQGARAILYALGRNGRRPGLAPPVPRVV